jgi:hypothetical protein
VVLAITVNYFIGAAMSLRLLDASWGDYARSQAPALGLGLFTVIVAYPVRLGLISAGAGPLLVLAVTALMSLGLIGILYWARPAILGQYGILAMRHLNSVLGPRLARRESF